jgi:hypothetical protein
METIAHGADSFSESSQDRGRGIKYTFHHWRRGPLVLASKNTILIFDLRNMRMYSFVEGLFLSHKIKGVVSNQTQGRIILWVHLTSENYIKSVKEVDLKIWKRCMRELYPYQTVLSRLLYYLWYATTRQLIHRG